VNVDQLIGVLIAGLILAVIAGTLLKGIVRVISFVTLGAIAVIALAEVTGQTDLFPMLGSSSSQSIPEDQQSSPFSNGSESSPSRATNGEATNGETTTGEGTTGEITTGTPSRTGNDAQTTQTDTPANGSTDGTAPSQTDGSGTDQDPVNALW